jgi:nucleoid-associated protein YgaU
MATAAEAIRTDANDLLSTVDFPVTKAAATDRLIGKLKADVWRRDVAQATGVLRAQAQRTSRDFGKRVSPSPIQIVTVQGDTTLRKLSVVYYGTPDEWQRIADANAITGSMVTAGAQILIPPTSAAAS